MTSIIFINQTVVIYFGMLIILVGLFGTLMQAFVLLTTQYYRKTPCTFYFIVASIHECGIFITAYGPLVIAVLLGNEMKHLSIVWCKLRYFFITSCCAISSNCACMATIDQFFITSQHVRIRQLSSIKNTYRVCCSFLIFWWLHGTLWIYYQDMSPITGVCVYLSNAFFAYGIFFVSIFLCIAPCLIMVTFGILAYQNIRKTIFLSRFRADRQLTIVVFTQVMFAVIGLIPYAVNCAYAILTLHIQKNDNQKAKERLVESITYMFCSVAYGVSVSFLSGFVHFYCDTF